MLANCGKQTQFLSEPNNLLSLSIFVRHLFCYLRYLINISAAGTSGGGYGSHSVSLPYRFKKKLKSNKCFNLHI